MFENGPDIESLFNYKDLVINYYSERRGDDQRMKMRKKYSYIAIILIVFLFSACQKKVSNFDSTNKASNSTESATSIPDEIKSLLTLGKYSDSVELNGKRDSLSVIQKNQKFLFPKCRILSVSYSTFSEDSTFLSLNKKEILKLIDLIEDSPILKDGDSLSNYGIADNMQEKYTKLCIIYENSHGDLQNVWLNTFKGNILHFYDTSGEDYRIGPNEELVKFITKHADYRVLSTTDFNKIKRITVKYNEEEYNLSDDATKKFVKALRKLDKREDEFHDSNLTAIAYTSDGDIYHIKAAAGEYSENDIAIEGACYSNAENLIHLLEKQK